MTQQKTSNHPLLTFIVLNISIIKITYDFHTYETQTKDKVDLRVDYTNLIAYKNKGKRHDCKKYRPYILLTQLFFNKKGFQSLHNPYKSFESLLYPFA